MIVKEKDACLKDCPQKMMAPEVYNRTCIGAECMAWRWAVEDNPSFNNSKFPDPKDNAPFIRSKTHGYCGLAGQP